jgi:hypothetical protein
MSNCMGFDSIISNKHKGEQWMSIPGTSSANALAVGRRIPVRERIGVCHRERVP